MKFQNDQNKNHPNTHTLLRDTFVISTINFRVMGSINARLLRLFDFHFQHIFGPPGSIGPGGIGPLAPLSSPTLNRRTIEIDIIMSNI